MKSQGSDRENRYLPEGNKRTDRIDETWEGTNEQWWNWYLSLADNRVDDGPSELPVSSPVDDVQALSLEELRREMAQPYPLTDDQIRQFRADSYIRLTQFFSPGALASLRQEALRVFYKHHDHDPKRQFSSMELMWLESDAIKEIVTGRRLAQLAATLLGVPRVRMFHDDFLCKEPGGGRTPWHYDGHHYPIVSRNIGTVWFPLQPTPRTMGMLELAKGMQTHKIVQEIPFDKFSRDHDHAVAESMKKRDVVIDTRPFELGEISFQHCLNVHGAATNRTSQPRLAYGASYFEDGARVVDSPTIISGDWQKFMPGVRAGEPLCSPYNPLVFGGGGE